MSSVGGRCAVSSLPGQGTRVELTLFIHGLASPVVVIGENDFLG
jgi:hypothetical protein